MAKTKQTETQVQETVQEQTKIAGILQGIAKCGSPEDIVQIMRVWQIIRKKDKAETLVTRPFPTITGEGAWPSTVGLVSTSKVEYPYLPTEMPSKYEATVGGEVVPMAVFKAISMKMEELYAVGTYEKVPHPFREGGIHVSFKETKAQFYATPQGTR